MNLCIKEHIPLKDYSTFRLGGPAKFFTRVHTVNELKEAIAWARSHSLPFLVLGKGSNSLFSDQGYQGLIILNKIDFIHQNEGSFHAGAGSSFSLLGSKSAKSGYSGLEFAVGIPASVGGAVFMNAGANKGATFDYLQSVDILDERGECQTLEKEVLRYGYRSSIFQEKSWIITAASFLLKKDPYAKDKQQNILDYRLQTQPYSKASAGCIFKNPGTVSAGQLIEEAGLKDCARGAAAVSSLHANFIVNEGGASLEEVKDLAKYIQKQVKEKHGQQLEAEVFCIDEKGNRGRLC